MWTSDDHDEHANRNTYLVFFVEYNTHDALCQMRTQVLVIASSNYRYKCRETLGYSPSKHDKTSRANACHRNNSMIQILSLRLVAIIVSMCKRTIFPASASIPKPAQMLLVELFAFRYCRSITNLGTAIARVTPCHVAYGNVLFRKRCYFLYIKTNRKHMV